MQDEKWQDLVDTAQKHFKFVTLTTEDLIMDTQDGPIKTGTQDVLIFTNPAGKFKVVRENKPVVLEKRNFIPIAPDSLPRRSINFPKANFPTKFGCLRKWILTSGMR